MRVVYIEAKRALTKSKLGFYTLNPYIGCYHACRYCYAKIYARDFYGLKNWGEILLVKKNLPDLLKKEAKRGIKVLLSTMTDPYQPIEALELLSRRSIEVLGERRAQISILTKNPLVIRDIDLFQRYNIEVGFSIISIKPHPLEERAPHPIQRMRALKKLKKEGIRTYVFVGPILLETDVEEIVKKTKNYADYYIFDRLRHHKETGLGPFRPDKRKIMEIVEKYQVRARILW